MTYNIKSTKKGGIMQINSLNSQNMQINTHDIKKNKELQDQQNQQIEIQKQNQINKQNQQEIAKQAAMATGVGININIVG